MWGKDLIDQDTELLTAVLDREDLSDKARAAFEDMLAKLNRGPLKPKQREWALAVSRGERYVPPEEYVNAWSSGTVPRGREVPTPPALQHLPKRPPGRTG